MPYQDEYIDALVNRLTHAKMSKSDLIDWMQENPRQSDAYGHQAEVLANQAIMFDPIDITPYTGEIVKGSHYVLEPKGQFGAMISSPHRNVLEFDGLWFHYGMPIVLEVKMGRGKVGDNLAPKMARALKPRREKIIEKCFADLFGHQDFASICMFQPEVITLNSTLQQEFVKRGGYLVPFPIDKKSYTRALRYAA